MRAKFGLVPTAVSKMLSFKFISRLGVRSLANASRARQFNPLNPLGWVPLPQTNMAAVVGRARSCAVVRGRSFAVVRAWSVMRGRAWSCAVVRGRALSCAVVRAWSVMRGRSCVVVRGRAWSCAVLRGRACVVGHSWSCAVGRAWSCAVVRSCRSARFAASTAVTRTNEGTNEQHILTP